MARPRKFKSAKALSDAWEQYKTWCNDQEVLTHDFSSKNSEFVSAKLKRSVTYTIEGFCVWAGISRSIFYSTYGADEKFSDIVTRMKEECEVDARMKFVLGVIDTRFRGGPYSFCFKSFNPPAMARNWANQYVREQKDRRRVHHSTYETTPPEWLGPKFLNDAQRLKETNETSYRHEYLGEVVGSGLAVFENLRLEAITDEQIKAFDYHYFGQDWGWYP